MTEETNSEKKGLFSKTWTKVTAGVLGGTLILGGTFATGAIAGATSMPKGFERVATVANSEEHQQSRVGMQANGKGQGKQGNQESMMGKKNSGKNHNHANMSEEERLEKINEWLDSIGVDALEKLPDELSGSAEELSQRRQLDMINHRLERLGIEALDELPEKLPNS
ncbi:MAG: hypothetical protein RI530_02220 [Microbacteriaceae bacterium]|nr:hypothetical protein [Microbacteriaceae bacterium]